MITIQDIRIIPVTLQLKAPFVTHLGNVEKRSSLIVEVTDATGARGYGECVAFDSPWYTEETCATAQHVLSSFLIPRLRGMTVQHPSDTQAVFRTVKRHPMAKAAIDMALWDLYAQWMGLPLYQLLGGTRSAFEAGVVIGMQPIEHIIADMEHFVARGFQHFKLKIAPGHDEAIIATVREKFPDLSLMVDANGSYDEVAHLDRLLALDPYHLRVIEQPYGEKAWQATARLQQQMQTMIGLDESIASVEDAALAIELCACRAMSVKVGRIGGITPTLELLALAKRHHISLWCGGMLETGIGRAHALAVASLPHFDLPIEFSDATRYWERDVTDPVIEAIEGRITLMSDVGLGYTFVPE
jgi:O-succinylbenzoate synthase